jgi:glycogen operon protein
VLRLRAKQQRNFLATLLLSQGVPMILHGDELGRTQGGNNNSYAQDSPISWVHWDQADDPLVEFTAAVSRLRKEHPTFRRGRFFDGRPAEDAPAQSGAPLADIVWLRPDGTEMQPADWNAGFGRAVGVFLNGDGIRERDVRGEEVTDLDFLLLFNAGDDPVTFKVPRKAYSPAWDVIVDTAGRAADRAPLKPGANLPVEGRSMMVLQEHHDPETEVDHSVAASLAALATAQITTSPSTQAQAATKPAVQ